MSFKKIKRTKISVNIPDKRKFDRIKESVTSIEGRHVSDPEIMRRVLNTKIEDRLKEDALEKKRFRFNRRGLVNQVMLILGIIVIFAGIIVAFFLFGLVSPPLLDAVNQVADSFVTSTADVSALANATNQTVVPVNNAIQNIQFLGYVLLVGMFLAFIMFAYFVRLYPFMLVFWIMGIVVLLTISIFMSAGYVNTIQDSNAFYTENRTNDFIMGNLPFLVGGFGLLGGVILFMLVPRDQEVEGAIV